MHNAYSNSMTIMTYFMTKCVHFMTKFVHFMTKCVHFMTKCVHFMTKCVHFMTKCVHFMAIVPTSHMLYCGWETDHTMCIVQTISHPAEVWLRTDHGHSDGGASKVVSAKQSTLEQCMGRCVPSLSLCESLCLSFSLSLFLSLFPHSPPRLSLSLCVSL